MARREISFRHKALVDEYFANGGNMTQAWLTTSERKTYPQFQTPHYLTWKTFKRPHVRRYIKEKLRRMVKRSDITEDRILTQYQAAYEMAAGDRKPSEMIAASREQAKLVGLLKDRIETGAPGSFGDLDTVSDVLERLAEQIGPELTQRIAQALEVLPEPSTAAETAVENAIALLDADAPSDAVN